MQAAFATGAGFSVADFYLLVAAGISAAVLIWAAWTLAGHYLYWAKGGGEIVWLGSAIITVLTVVTVLVGFL